jgi:Na+-transporting methylmalonyl-CoA/oxaloacetate decarboxylase gamma subunit
MTSRKNVPSYCVLSMALLAVVVFAVGSVAAQEEPTPVPEPAKEEPAAAPAPAEPAVAPEPAAAAEPAEEPEPPVAAIPITYRNKTLVTVDGKAQANGVVEFIVQPQGGEAVKVRVNVLAKAKAKEITDDMLKELDFTIDERYKVSRSGDKKIVIKVTKKNPPIAITLKTQSLSGVSVTVSNG